MKGMTFSGKGLCTVALCALFTTSLLASQAAFATGKGNSQEKQAEQRAKISAKTQARLDARFARGETVRVIIDLKSSDEPAAATASGRLDSRAKRQGKRDAIARLQQRTLNKLARTSGVKRFRNLPAIAMELDSAQLELLQAAPEVVSIAEDILFEPSLAESIPIIGADTSWSLGHSGMGQTVAILDTGVDTSHAAFAGKTITEACFSTGSGSATSLCPNGANPGGADQQLGLGAGAQCSGVSSCSHGTHVAGIAVANTDTYAGVARDADLIAIQVFSKFSGSSCGSASNCVLAYMSDVLRALDWIDDQRGSINIASANLSLGAGKYTSYCDNSYSPLANAINNLRQNGVATVISAGNSGHADALGLPACMSGAVSVGATTNVDAIPGYSNTSSYLSLLAPGSGIKSAMPGGGYANKSGTSMAAPHVAGSFAVLRAAAPTATVNELLQAMTSTGVQLTDSGLGIPKPRVQLDDALAQLTGVVAPPPPPEPEPEPEPVPETPAPGNADFALALGELHEGEYGFRFGSSDNRDAVVASFESTGATVEFSVVGFDVDTATEVTVLLNDNPIGYLSEGTSNRLNSGDRFVLPASEQIQGTNLITLRVYKSGWRWGVTDFLITTGGESPPEPEVPEVPEVPAGSDISLSLNVMDSTGYGNRFGTQEYIAELKAGFQSNGNDLILELKGFDIDFDDEILVYLNGTVIGNFSVTPDGALGERERFNIPAALQNSGSNQLLFKQKKAGWKWGVTDLLLSD